MSKQSDKRDEAKAEKKRQKTLAAAVATVEKAEKKLRKALKAEGKKKRAKAAERLSQAQQHLAEVSDALAQVGSRRVDRPAEDAEQPAPEAQYAVGPTGVQITGAPVSLADISPSSHPGFDGTKDDAEAQLAEGAAVLSALQEKLFAQSRSDETTPAVLLVLQGMDTSGKGGIVRHVVGAVDPQGVEHVAFKAPTEEEKKHDFLWRIEKHVPGPGYIGVFDRSHYEDVLIHRVHGWADEAEIQRRYAAIADFEKGLADRGVKLVKVMLHISPEEQADRLQERLERPDKYWKYNPGDLTERAQWAAYQEAYEKALEATSSEDAPWTVVPADSKWYARLAVQNLLIEALQEIGPSWPAAHFNVGAERARLTASRRL